MPSDALARLEAALDTLAEVDPVDLKDTDAILRLTRSFARLDAIYTRATAALEAGGEWQASRALSAGAYLAAEARLPLGEARRRIGLGRSLRHLPTVEAAWLEGSINAGHATRLAGARNPRTAEAMARDEALLVDKAKTLRYEWFSKVVAYWLQGADPDGAEESDRARRERRDVYLVRSLDDMYLGRVTLDPISGTIVASELERLESLLFKTDWAEARVHLGREPQDVSELARTPGQRRADALVEMAVRSRIAPADGQRPAPLFVALVDYPSTLGGRMCELYNGAVVSPGSLVPWLEQAYVERAVFGPRGRVEVSERARFFTGATRRAIQIRDHAGCTHPYCYAPAHRCQADHIVPYAEGGLTVQENGRLACPRHNRGRQGNDPAAQWTGPAEGWGVEEADWVWAQDPDPPLRS